MLITFCNLFASIWDAFFINVQLFYLFSAILRPGAERHVALCFGCCSVGGVCAPSFSATKDKFSPLRFRQTARSERFHLVAYGFKGGFILNIFSQHYIHLVMQLPNVPPEHGPIFIDVIFTRRPVVVPSNAVP